MSFKFTKRYVFTTGAYLVPCQIDGVWQWVVAEFEDDTFEDGECVSVKTSADTETGLFEEE